MSFVTLSGGLSETKFFQKIDILEKDNLVFCYRKRARTPIGALKDCRCMNHPSELLSMYCTICRTAVCCVCLQEIRHTNHDVQSLEKTCKSQKVKLSNLPVYFSILTSPYAQMVLLKTLKLV